jgi:hypothetical protein
MLIFSLKNLATSMFITYFVALILGLALLSTGFYGVHAQTSEQFIPFWQARAYAPADFLGKVFPTERTVIDASFELLAGGKFVDLSKRDVIWLVNGNEIGEGVGKKSLTFKNYAYGGDVMEVEVRIFGSDGRATPHSFNIPASAPRLVLRSPYNAAELSARALELSALPYFFNVNTLAELAFAWNVNGVAPEGTAGDPDHLSVEVPSSVFSGAQITVTATAKNSAASLEEAQGQVVYSVAK